jgi:predicted phosphodiesterase
MLMIAFSDIHAPFQDGRAIDLLCQIIEFIKPDTLINMGDWVDFYALSTFDKEPSRITKLQEELDGAFSIAQMINGVRIDGSKVMVLEGNHERRLRRYLAKHPELSSLNALVFENLLRLNELGWSVSKEVDRVNFLNGRLRLKHGEFARKHSAYSAKAELENVRFQINTISGHSHRLGSTYARGPRHLVGGWEAGCLCSLEPVYKRDPDWHQGCVVVEISDQQGVHTFQPYSIAFTGKRPKRAMFWGKEFVAR